MFLHALAGCEHDAHWFETFVEDGGAPRVLRLAIVTRHPRAATVRENWKSLNELSTHRQNQSTTQDAPPTPSSALASVIDDLSASNSELRAEIEQLKLAAAARGAGPARPPDRAQRGDGATARRARGAATGTRRAKLRASKAEKQLAAVRVVQHVAPRAHADSSPGVAAEEALTWPTPALCRCSRSSRRSTTSRSTSCRTPSTRSWPRPSRTGSGSWSTTGRPIRRSFPRCARTPRRTRVSVCTSAPPTAGSSRPPTMLSTWPTPRSWLSWTTTTC